jgi:hypothetical protein
LWVKEVHALAKEHFSSQKQIMFSPTEITRETKMECFMKTQSEHGASVKKSSGARVAHPWQSEHVPSANKSNAARITRTWSPTDLIATSRTVKQAGDLHRPRDYSQGQNKQTSDVEIPYKSGFRGAAARADQLLDKMEAKHQAGDMDLKPNTFTYNAVINALAKSGEAGAAARAERVLQNMVNRHRNGGGDDISPTTININTVLDAWAKTDFIDTAPAPPITSAPTSKSASRTNSTSTTSSTSTSTSTVHVASNNTFPRNDSNNNNTNNNNNNTPSKLPIPGTKTAAAGAERTEKRRDEHSVKATQFPSQPSGYRRRRPPSGIQRQSSFQVAKAQSEHGPPSLNKSGGSRGANLWHSDHGPSIHHSARIIQPWLKYTTANEAEDPNTGIYEPFLETIGIPSQFSGDRGSHSQQMQTKQSMKKSKRVLPGGHQKKSHSRASSTSSGSAPAPPKLRLPRPKKSLDDNVLMGQLGGPVRASRKAPTPPRRRQQPKATKSQDGNESKGKLDRQPLKATTSQGENGFKDELGRHSGHYKINKDDTASEPLNRGAIPPSLARIMQRRGSTGTAQVGPEPILARIMQRRGSTGIAQVGPAPNMKRRGSAGFAPESRVNNISGPPLSLTALRGAKKERQYSSA